MATAKKGAAKKPAAKKPAAKKPAAKKGAKPAAKKIAKKTVAGRNVTAEVKSKGSKKDYPSCERIDIGGGKVVDLCVRRPKKPKAKSAEGDVAVRVGGGAPGEFKIRRPKTGIYNPRSVRVTEFGAPVAASPGRMTKTQKQELRLSQLESDAARGRYIGSLRGTFMPVRPSTGVRRRKRSASR